MFGPGSLTWRVNGEAVLLLGGARALILQVAHPKVAAGVAEHSDFRADPWRRLYRTLDTTLTIAFGTAAASAEASGRLRARHARVSGTNDCGERYAALDPELLLWVHATLIDTSLLIYERYVGSLTARERVDYYEEMRLLGEGYAIPAAAMPVDLAAFRRYWGAMLADGLRVTQTTREVADAVLNPQLPVPAPAARELLRLVSVGTLPSGLRQQLGLSWGPRRERLLRVSELAIRRLLPTLPALMRRFPGAREGPLRAA